MSEIEAVLFVIVFVWLTASSFIASRDYTHNDDHYVKLVNEMYHLKKELLKRIDDTSAPPRDSPTGSPTREERP